MIRAPLSLFGWPWLTKPAAPDPLAIIEAKAKACEAARLARRIGRLCATLEVVGVVMASAKRAREA